MRNIHVNVNGHHVIFRKFLNGLWDAIDYDTGVLIYEGDDATLEKVLDVVIEYTTKEVINNDYI